MRFLDALVQAAPTGPDAAGRPGPGIEHMSRIPGAPFVPRRTYVAPRVTALGDVRELTRGNGSGGADFGHTGTQRNNVPVHK
jgi:hypothetical protein